jgi:hypothetical protein
MGYTENMSDQGAWDAHGTSFGHHRIAPTERYGGRTNKLALSSQPNQDA